MTRLKNLSLRHGLAFLALFIALGGSATAATLINGKNIKKGTVTSKQVKDRSLLAKDFKAGQLPKGKAGATGLTGTSGAMGPAGVMGATGEKGAMGPAGPKGLDGSAAAQGDPGAPGEDGAPGADGENGADGEDGAPGADGEDGAPGADGEDGATGPARVPVYAYVYNETAQTVPAEDTVEFDTNGLLTADVAHAPGDNAIVVSSPGVYKVTFTVSSTQPSQFALFVNGAPAPGSIYGAGGQRQTNTGQLIMPLQAGDVLSLVNHSSATGAVDLPTAAGGTQANVNASMLIEQLG